MSKFVYKARDWNGKLVKGVVDVAERTQAVESVKSSGLIPLYVGQERETSIMKLVKRLMGRIKLKDVSTLTRQLSTMMTAGLPLTDALSLLRDQSVSKVALYEILDTSLNMVRGGQPLAKALEKFENVFGEAYIASIRAGEEAGVLEEILQKLAANLEGQDEFNGKVKGAMIYPVIVVIGMLIVTVIMMVFVVPKLTSMYADFGTAKMPTATLLLMSMSDFMVKWWFLFPFIFGGIYTAIKVGLQNPEFRLKFDTFKLKFPVIGKLTRTTMLANTIRTLSMLLAAGISLVEALKIVAKVSENELYFRAYMKISERVQKGFSIASSFEEVGIFPIIVNQMVSTGEATGKLDEVLMKVSNYFSTEAEQAVKALTSAIEPLIMIVLGIGVGFLVIAVIMPIYNLTSSF